jgi:hypothetical protein
MVSHRIRVVSEDPADIPHSLREDPRVEVAAAAGWDDDDVPDDTVLHFNPDVEHDTARLADAVERAAEDAGDLTIVIERGGGVDV